MDSRFSSPSSGRVLVVDDLPANVKLLATILRLEGFEVVTATCGLEALQFIEGAAPGESPDVVLLDVMMPEMDGFETCRRIRANQATQHLPVVMVTALHEVSDRVRALEAGADDFLTKPVEEVEVLARVRSLVRAKQSRDALERAYADLRRAEELRDNLTHMLVHDLRTPLTSVLVTLDLLREEQIGVLNDTQKELIAMSTRSSGQLLKLVNELLDVAKLESGQMTLDCKPVAVAEVLEDALREVEPLLATSQSQIEREGDATLPTIALDADLVRRVLVNFLFNALKFSPQGAPIVLGAQTDDTQLKVWVRDKGCGIAPEFQARIWDKFGQAEARQSGARFSTGLGLTFCKLAVEAHGGGVGVQSEVGQGSTFHFWLPLAHCSDEK